jgi:hypothetical protein
MNGHADFLGKCRCCEYDQQEGIFLLMLFLAYDTSFALPTKNRTA